MADENTADTDEFDAWLGLPLAERNAAFDVNAAVANSAELVARRNALSEAFRARRPEKLDIPYSDHGPNCAFDLYPAKDPAAPCMVFVHGGWWQRNGRENFACYADGLAQNGWSVAMAGYTLAPAIRLSGIVAEIGVALDWLASEGGRHGIDGPVVLVGWSAGAHLASFHLGHPRVSCGLAVAGLYDLERFRATSFNDAVQLTEDEVRELAPINRAPVAKPMTIAVGTNERPLLVAGAEAFHRHRQAVDPGGVLLHLEGEDHFTILDGFLRPDGVLVQAAQDVLARTLA